MEFDVILQLVKPELIIIIVACYVLGLFLKQSKLQDWLIPFILLFFAVIMTVLYIAIVMGEGFNAKVVIVSILQGLLCAAVAVYGNNVIKQLTDKKNA